MAQRLFGYSLSSTVVQPTVVLSPSPVRAKKPLRKHHLTVNPVKYECLPKKCTEHDYQQLYGHHR
jgi:hypothetical protein